MSNAEVHDYTAAEAGALPSLDGNPASVLGEPTTRRRTKSNVGKAFILVLALFAFLLIVGGLLWFLKARRAAAPDVTAAAAKPGVAQRNQALESTTLERTKSELRLKQAQEEKANRDALAALDEQRKAQQPQHGQVAQQAGGNQPAGAAGPSAPPPLTPDQRRLTGDVLVGQAGSPAAPAGAAGPRTTASPGGVEALGAARGGPEGIGARLQPTILEGRSAGLLPNLDYLLKKGMTIPCALNTGIDTTLPGFVKCTTLTDLYSANGKTLLAERGTQIFGEQQSSLKQGQARTFVVWSRMDTPTGVFANLDSPATDQMGYNGIEGYVDTHFWARFGGAIMLSLIRDFSQSLTQKQSSSGNTGPTYNNSQQAAQDMSSEALRNSINIPPTLTVLPGTVVNVMVARDVSFENVYTLVK